MTEIIKYIKTNGGFATTKELNQAKFHSREIKLSLQKGEIEKIKKGFYRISNFSYFEDVNISLITICRAEPKAIISLISALDYYEMTDFNPSEIYYSIPHSQKKKDFYTPPVNVFYFRERFYNIGINKIYTEYGDIKIYNKEKTVCDMFRYRNTLGEDLAMQALKNYLNQKNKSIATLMEYAELCQVKTVIMPLLKGMIF
ncbi:MAG: type IV toxin-antitoxin system AbiEi family antitoxin domain-containing protein [Melioribacteraceae bacterium]|nr:type IV toxin-antitoxin system AbiEi family antitoxin domain-containing protein [Melioribacteraceae bacterium]